MKYGFFIHCNPPKTTAQATTRIFKNKNGQMFIGKDKRGQTVRQELMTLLMPYVPMIKFEGAVELTVRWQYPFRKSETKKNMEKGKVWCTTRSDCDNLAKLLCDTCTRLGFWDDDAQIAVLHFEKFYSAESGIFIQIENLD